jgi:hypothetical protein
MKQLYALSTLLLLASACTADDTTGDVAAAITATGGDGATYRLTPGTRLTVSGTGLPSYDVGLDGDGAVVSIPVAPGNYQASIYHPNGYTTEWPLERTLGGTTTIVTGELITPQPAPLTVVSQETTSFVLQFGVATAGTVTFDRGTVGVSVGVTEQPAKGFTAGADGTGNVVGTPQTDGPNAAALAALLPGAGATGLHVTVSGHLTGPWAEAGGTRDPDGLNQLVCAPFQLDASSASGNDGLVALVAEANHGVAPDFLYGNANLCVVDDGTTSHVRIRFSREGAAETPAFTTILGTAPALFHVQVIGDLPTRVYNSDTGVLDANALLGAGSLPMKLRLQVRDGNDIGSFWYAATATGTETFTFAGTP